MCPHEAAKITSHLETKNLRRLNNQLRFFINKKTLNRPPRSLVIATIIELFVNLIFYYVISNVHKIGRYFQLKMNK